MLRRTERATAREREIEQEQRDTCLQRSTIRETRASNHNIFSKPFFISHTFYKNLLLGLQSPQGARFNPISDHRLLATKASFCAMLSVPQDTTHASCSIMKFGERKSNLTEQTKEKSASSYYFNEGAAGAGAQLGEEGALQLNASSSPQMQLEIRLKWR